MLMDDLDRKLISLLRKDARMTAAALAAKLGVSRNANVQCCRWHEPVLTARRLRRDCCCRPLTCSSVIFGFARVRQRVTVFNGLATLGSPFLCRIALCACTQCRSHTARIIEP